MSLLRITLAGLILSVSSTSGAVTNGSFSNGLSGWSVIGDVQSTAGITRLTNASLEEDDFPSPAGAFNLSGSSAALADQLEPFLGISAYGLGTGALEGSAIKQTFSAQAGQTLTFNWQFSTNEGETTFPDFGFVLINGNLTTLATPAQTFASTSGYARSSSLSTFSYVFTTSGSVDFAAGVVDIDDYTASSELAISNVELLAPVPEPITMALWAAGLGIVGAKTRRRR